MGQRSWSGSTTLPVRSHHSLQLPPPPPPPPPFFLAILCSDSHLVGNVIFSDPFSALRALKGLTGFQPPSASSPSSPPSSSFSAASPEEAEQDEQFRHVVVDELASLPLHLLLRWRSSKPYKSAPIQLRYPFVCLCVDCFTFSRFLRFATSLDSRADQPKPSAFLWQLPEKQRFRPVQKLQPQKELSTGVTPHYLTFSFTRF